MTRAEADRAVWRFECRMAARELTCPIRNMYREEVLRE